MEALGERVQVSLRASIEQPALERDRDAHNWERGEEPQDPARARV